MKQIRSGLLALIVGAVLAIPAGTQAAGSDKFIPTFLVYYGGGPQLVARDAAGNTRTSAPVTIRVRN